MHNPRLASRYAKSLIDLAVEKNCLEDVLKDMQLLDSICRQSREFEIMLRSPVIKGEKKLAVINAVVKDNFNAFTKAFVNLLVVKGREQNLGEIATAFITQYNEMKDIITVKLTTAVAIDDTIKNSIMGKVAGYMNGGTIDLKTEVDSTLIGGFVMELEDRIFDASVKKKLSDVKASIVDYSYVSKMA